MKKNTRDLIIGVIIGLVISGTITFALDTYSTDQVIYIRDNQEEDLTISMNEIYDHMYSGNATAGQIRKNKTALVNGQLITGTGEVTKEYELDRKEITRSFSARSGTARNCGGSWERCYDVNYSIDISNDYSNCHNITQDNIGIERPTLTAVPQDFGGVSMYASSYDPNTCTVSITTRARKGFSYGTIAETFKIIIFSVKEKTG